MKRYHVFLSTYSLICIIDLAVCGTCLNCYNVHCYTLVKKYFNKHFSKHFSSHFIENPFTFFKKLFIYFRWADELIRDKRKSIDNR